MLIIEKYLLKILKLYLLEFLDTRTPLNVRHKSLYNYRKRKQRKIYTKFTYFNFADCVTGTIEYQNFICLNKEKKPLDNVKRNQKQLGPKRTYDSLLLAIPFLTIMSSVEKLFSTSRDSLTRLLVDQQIFFDKLKIK